MAAKSHCFEDFVKGDLKQFCTLIGESEHWVEILNQFQICFHDGYLFLAVALEDDPSALEQATAALIHLWSFSVWSDSRWCGIGPTSRSMLCCTFRGLADAVSMTLACPTSSKY